MNITNQTITPKRIWIESGICVELQDGSTHGNLVPLSLFPLSDGSKHIILLDQDHREICMVEDLEKLTPDLSHAITVELLRNRFMLKLIKIHKVSSFRTPAEWSVLTDRGESSLILPSEESLRRLPDDGALIQDSQGLRYLVQGISKMDGFSRKVIEYYI
ncbi:MAG: hypothetical protein RIR17_311 [Planctomycetota bacterium]|jgi:hypothetical protein